ncbi:amidoligase family protein [Adhaeribacter aquaticus]|uniref:amidoligase family protein n=1 Tax=Adhaeribacter aquaticus TaxID=299567 RepID=UPI00040D0BE5|nr:amidoligase family protein [Adhaeribacter aquaticus]
MEFKQLPVLYNEQGELRKVGFELEFANLGIDEIVKIILDIYGGRVEKENRFLQKVCDTRIGNFSVEFDLTLLTEKKYIKFFDSFNINLQEYKCGVGTLEDSVEAALEGIVGKIFPYEIATPPVPCTEIAQFEELRQALFEHNAKGTEAFPTNAFGTHINIELPATDAETIISYLKAFVLLYPWLLEVGETDLARKLSPFIDPFPEEYAQLILAQNYAPDLDTLVADYHRYNPDRNRPIDMYPLFAAINPDKVNQFQDVGKVKPRKTFHYRLPNSSISKPDWTLAQEWNNWVVVEELAHNPEKIEAIKEAYFRLKQDTILGFEGKWIKQISAWLT